MDWRSVHRIEWINIALRAALAFGIIWLAVGFATTDILAVDFWRGTSRLPLVRFCLIVFLACVLLLRIFERSLAPLLVGAGILAVAAFGPAAILASISLLWVAYLLGELVVRYAPDRAAEPAAFLIRVALGLIVIDLILNIAIALPLHDIRIYTLVFLSIVAARWRGSASLVREMRALWQLCRAPLGFWSSLGAIATAVMMRQR